MEPCLISVGIFHFVFVVVFCIERLIRLIIIIFINGINRVQAA